MLAVSTAPLVSVCPQHHVQVAEERMPADSAPTIPLTSSAAQRSHAAQAGTVGGHLSAQGRQYLTFALDQLILNVACHLATASQPFRRATASPMSFLLVTRF